MNLRIFKSFALLCIMTQVASGAIFTGIGVLAENEASLSYAISADGSTVVGASWDSNGWMRSVKFDVGTGTLSRVPVSPPEDLAIAVSADGTYITGATGNNAYRWSSVSGQQNLSTTSSVSNNPTGISGDGSIIVGNGPGGAYQWNLADGTVALPFASSSSVQDITDDGTLAVGRVGNEASIWNLSNGTTTGIGTLPGEASSWAYVISGDGSVVAGTGEANNFIWDAVNGMQVLPINPRDMTLDGTYVVGSFNSEAVIWSEAMGAMNMEDFLTSYGIDLGDWSLSTVTGISADGLSFTGTGKNADGITEGWYASVPEPAETIALFAVVALFLAMAFKMKRKR